jgi:hypothetical protein
MPDLISSIQLSIDIARKLRDVNEQVKNVDFKSLLADLQEKLADSKLEVVALKEQLADLSRKNVELSAIVEVRSSEQPEPMKGGYRLGDKGPFCVACFETQGKKVLLPPASGIHAHFGQWYCPVCKNHS